MQGNASPPVIISVMTPQQFVSGFNGSIPGCEWRGQSLGCHYVVPRNDPQLHMRSGGTEELAQEDCNVHADHELSSNPPAQLQSSPILLLIGGRHLEAFLILYAVCVAEAVFYHGPNLCLEYHNNGTRVVKSTRRQLAVLMTMESAAYYPCFDDPVFMGPFDLEISYRREVGMFEHESSQ